MRVRKGAMNDAIVLLAAGAERSEVRGRTAVIVGELNRIQDRINAIPVGRVIIHFAHGQLKVE
jgi:hypothetical protein